MNKILANSRPAADQHRWWSRSLVGAACTRWCMEEGGRFQAAVHRRLAPEDAAGIVQKLKEAGVEYRLPEGGGVGAGAFGQAGGAAADHGRGGLPKTGRIGFELFDKTNLGATEFTEHVNYRRALEGELERSVMSLAEVEQARVHLTFPKDSVFLEAQQPAKASVLVRIKPGARAGAAECRRPSITWWRARWKGFRPTRSRVLDMNGNLLGRPKPAAPLDGPEPPRRCSITATRSRRTCWPRSTSTLEPLLGRRTSFAPACRWIAISPAANRARRSSIRRAA